MFVGIKNRWPWGIVLCIAISAAGVAGRAFADTPLNGAFTYQGQLQSSGSPYTGTADLRFTLWADSTGTTQIGGNSVASDVTIANGLFTTTVNANGEFGASPFNGSQRWLKIGVRTPHDPTNTQPFTPLTPRQLLTGTPNALGLALPFASAGTSPAAPLFTIQNGGFGQAISGQSALGHGVYGRNGAGSGLIPLNGWGTGVWGDTDNGNGIAGTSGTGFGVYGAQSPISGLLPPAGSGVVGDSHDRDGVTGLSATGVGVFALSTSGVGVYGELHDSNHQMSFGQSAVQGDTDLSNGYGVYGGSSGANGIGVRGDATGSQGFGVYGDANSTSGFPVGVFGSSPANGRAGYFQGDVEVTGTLYKGGGSFKIDDPLDPQNKYLYHSFVESPDMKNIYDGVVTTDGCGYATITLPDWFEALNRDFRYQLTVIDSTDSEEFVQAKVVKGVANDRFTLRTSRPETRVSWQVTGIRHDAFANAHRIPVVEDKPLAERGLYLYPKEIGQPENLGFSWQMERRDRMGSPDAQGLAAGHTAHTVETADVATSRTP